MDFWRAFSSKKCVSVSTNNNFINTTWHMPLKLWQDLFPEFHGQKVLECVYWVLNLLQHDLVCLKGCGTVWNVTTRVNVQATLSVHILTRCDLKFWEAQMVDRVQNCDGWKITYECWAQLQTSNTSWISTHYHVVLVVLQQELNGWWHYSSTIHYPILWKIHPLHFLSFFWQSLTVKGVRSWVASPHSF